MIKWKYVIVRLVLLFAVLAAIHYSSSPLIKLVVQSTVQWMTGSKMEIEDLQASPFQTRVAAGRVQITDPGDPMKNVIEFENAEINLDQNLLLRKKFVVTSGSLTGLQLGTARETSGEIKKSDASQSRLSRLANDALASTGKKAGEGLVSLFNQRFDENFESVRLSKDLVTRWPAEYEKLLTRAKDLENRLRSIRDLYESFTKNPLNTLRDFPRIEQAVKNTEIIKSEIRNVDDLLKNYRNQIRDDKQNILAAKHRDIARVYEIKNEKTLNGRTISQLLIGDEYGRRVDQTIGWIKWMRKTFPHPKKQLAASRSRGQTIHFPGTNSEPDFLIQSLTLHGHGSVDEKPYQFTGKVAGLTSQPEKYGKPAFLQLKSEGGIEFALVGLIDRSQEVDRDKIEVTIPALKIAAQEVKLSDDVIVKLSKSELRLKSQVTLTGDKLAGSISATQSNVALEFSSNVDNEFAQQLSRMLQADLAQINRFQTNAKLSGTTDDPVWELQTDLGNQLANAIQSTVTRGYELKKKEMLAKLNFESEKALQKIDKLVSENEQKIANFLRSKSGDLLKLEERVTSLLKLNGLRFR